MDYIHVKTRAGDDIDVEASEGRSVMELIRDAGIDDIVALCGGSCSCATCHVYVAQEFADLLVPIKPFESELLDGSSHRSPFSRLSCQIQYRPDLKDLGVTIAPEE